MKLFKTIDEKIEQLGFTKTEENNLFCRYERERKEGYIQYVDLLHKHNGKHILQSYDKDSFDEKGIGNTGVGLTVKEMELFSKKMRKLFH